MSKNRYGRIYHSNHNHINLCFPSADARDEFAVKFQKYHDSHDHDGEAPRFEEIKASEAGSTTYESGKLHDAHSVTIDGYASYEIEEYHEDQKHTYYYRYKPPTCCVAPLISIQRKLIDSSTLERHEMSAIFRDMSDEEYQSLLVSVEQDGFIDNVVRLYEGQILDGWNRYRAAKELNLIRKLRFKQWHEDEHRDGDPRVFVLGRNLYRRHQDKAVRAQITVTFNERFGLGMNQHSERVHQNDEPKTREELAKEAGVSTATIDRAIVVEKEGKSEAVISGETTTGEVLKAREAEQKLKRKKKKLKSMWDTRIQASRDYLSDENAELAESLELQGLEDGFARYHEPLADAFKSGIKRYELARGDFARFEESAEEVSLEDVEKECKAMSIYAHDIANYRDADWIQKMIQWKKDALAEAAKPKPAPEPDLKTLRVHVKAEMPLWKKRDKEQCQYESDHIGKASFSMLISALRDSINYVADEETGEIPDGEATAAELKELLHLMKSNNFSLILAVHRQLKAASETEQPSREVTAAEAEQMEKDYPGVEVLDAKDVDPEPEPSDDPKALLEAQERADGSRRRMWSHVSSEIRTKGGKKLQDLSNEDIAKAAADALGLSRIEVPKDGIAFEAYEFIMGDIESPPYSLSDCTLSDARTWTARFYKIYDDIENRAEWVSELLADAETLRQQIEKNVRAVRDAYTEIYKKGAASVSAMFIAGITYYNLPKEGLELSLDNPTGGYTDETRLTRIEGVTAQMLRDFEGRVKAVWIRKSLSNDVDAKNLPLQNALDDMKARVPKPDAEPDSEPEEDTVKSLWEKIEPLISEWKSNRKDKGVGRASKTMLLSAAKRFLNIPKDAETDVSLLKQLLNILAEVHGPSYTFERYVKMQCDGASIWNEEKPEPDAETGEFDEDTSLTEIDNLPAVKYFLETLSKQVDTFTHQVDRDNFSCAIYDLFLSDGDVYLTERQQLAILIDVAHTLVNESESL